MFVLIVILFLFLTVKILVDHEHLFLILKIVRLHVLIQAVAGYYQWIIHAFILLKAVMKNMNLNTGMTSRRITKWQKNFQ